MDVEICLDPWNKPHGVVFFACIADFGLLTLFFSFLFFFEDIFTYVHREYQPVHSFLQDSFFVCLFAVRVMLASQNKVGNNPSSFIFWKSLSSTGIIFS